MSTFANTLKSEIARVARKELKGEIAALRKVLTAHRSEIAVLKRELAALQQTTRKMQKTVSTKSTPQDSVESDPPTERRGRKAKFGAQKLAAHRAKLGLTQAQLAQLIGVSTLSVYKWEAGKVTPRAAQQAQIAAVLKLGKRAAKAQLAGA